MTVEQAETQLRVVVPIEEEEGDLSPGICAPISLWYPSDSFVAFI
jgi:hypothetical protein